MARGVTGRDPDRPAVAAAVRAHLETHYRDAFSWAAIGMTITDLQGRFLRVNERFCELVGRSATELLRLSFQDITHPDHLRAHEVGSAQMLRVGSDHTEFEKIYLRPDQTPVPVRVTSVVVRDPLGEPMYFLNQVFDRSGEVLAEQRADATEARHRRILETAVDGYAAIDRAGVLTDFNPAAERMFGRTKQEVIGRHFLPTLFAPEVTEELGARIEKWLALPNKSTSGETYELTALRPDGRRLLVELSPWVWDDGSVHAFMWDVTTERQVARSLAESEQRWRLVFDEAPVGMALVALDGRLLQVNQAMCRFTGYSGEQLLTMRQAELIHPVDRSQNLRTFEQLLNGDTDHFQADVRYCTPSGELAWASLSVSIIRNADGAPLQYVAFVEDISKRRAQTEQLADLAARDPLTGLANRATMLDRIQAAVSADRSDFALAFLDLDGFKAINDRLGHQAGDELLRVAAQRIRDSLRSTDVAGRYGGDEFAILLQPIEDESHLSAIAERLLSAIAVPFTVAHAVAGLSASIGIARGNAVTAATDLLAEADAAMYMAKVAGRNTYRIS